MLLQESILYHVQERVVRLPPAVNLIRHIERHICSDLFSLLKVARLCEENNTALLEAL